MCTQCEKYCIHMQRKGVHFIIDGTKRLFSVIFLCQSSLILHRACCDGRAEAAADWGQHGALPQGPQERTPRQEWAREASGTVTEWKEIDFISNTKTVKHSKIWKYIFFLLKYVQISCRTFKKINYYTIYIFLILMRLRNAEILLLNILW